MSYNLFHQETLVSTTDRRRLANHDSFVLWFTGLSGSGKSTIASHLQLELFRAKKNTYMLDGDNLRLGLNGDLDFSENGRKENIRRISEVAKLFVDAGVITCCSFISPYITDRAHAKKIIGHENFIEVYVNCDLEECERRDIKGLYAKARRGEIKNFTGIDSPYEVPKTPDIEINTTTDSIEECTNIILKKIQSRLNSNE